jgi:hypothetical protein
MKYHEFAHYVFAETSYPAQTKMWLRLNPGSKVEDKLPDNLQVIGK